MFLRRLHFLPVLLCALTVCAEPPATRPATGVQQLQLDVLGLADPDALVREKSRQALMSLPRDRLPELRQALQPLRPLDDSIFAQLHDIVTQVWLMGEDYRTENRGFLGVTMGLLPGQPADDGIPVEARTRGFDAYRALQDGDLIVGIVEQPLARSPSPDEFAAAVRACRPGQTIHLRIIRRGQPEIVAVKVGAVPAAATVDGRVLLLDPMQTFIEKRDAAAEQFWERSFAEGLKTPQSAEGPATSRSASQ